MTVYVMMIVPFRERVVFMDIAPFCSPVTLTDISGYSLYMLEYVQVTVTLSHPVRGKLSIHLRCPSGTLSVIGAPRPNDK